MVTTLGTVLAIAMAASRALRSPSSPKSKAASLTTPTTHSSSSSALPSKISISLSPPSLKNVFFALFEALLLLLAMGVPPRSVDVMDLLGDGDLVQDPFFRFPTPRISWLPPESLVPHEHTSQPHLEALLSHLAVLPTTSLLPIPVVTASSPRVILDGHHRVAASKALGIRRIPVWEVDVEDEGGIWWASEGGEGENGGRDIGMEAEERRTSLRCYSRQDGRRIRIADVVKGARKGRVDWGIKGTKHVAVVTTDGREVPLVKVTPRIMWGVWRSAGKTNATDLIVVENNASTGSSDSTKMNKSGRN
ncbi:hypothetical protein HK102_005576 [Quaeritorhiza haematococci]|nr:hypothetical protein HK102_005576 [Quaeritorhiza haematococci]